MRSLKLAPECSFELYGMKDANCSKNLECSPPQSKKYSSTTCSEIHMRKVSGGDSSLSEFSHPASGKAACDRRFSHTHKNAHTHTHTHTHTIRMLPRGAFYPVKSSLCVTDSPTVPLRDGPTVQVTAGWLCSSTELT